MCAPSPIKVQCYWSSSGFFFFFVPTRETGVVCNRWVIAKKKIKYIDHQFDLCFNRVLLTFPLALLLFLASVHICFFFWLFVLRKYFLPLRYSLPILDRLLCKLVMTIASVKFQRKNLYAKINDSTTEKKQHLHQFY